MADTIGSIKYDFTIDTSKASQGISSAKKAASDVAKSAEAAANQSDSKFAAAWAKIGDGATKAAKKIGTALLNIGKTAAVAGAGAATAMATASVKMYADYEQNIGGVETLFKDAAGTVEQFANNAFKTAGMSANQYMETVTSFSARLLQGLGGDTEKAAQISNMAVEDMSDNANKMGTSMEAIQNAYQGFAKQNYTMLDNLKLGYGGTASEMARLINDSGVLGDTMVVTANNVNEVSFDKMIEAIHKVQEGMGITGTTAKEAASTISGSAKMMRAAWDNLLTFMGSGQGNLDEVMGQFIESVKTFGENVIPVMRMAVTGMAEVITELAPLIVAELPQILTEIIPPLVNATVQIVAALVAALPGVINSLIDAIIVAIPTIVDAIINMAPAFISGMLQIGQRILQAVPQLLPVIVRGIAQVATMLTSPQNLSTIFKAAIELFTEIVKSIPQIVIALIDALPQIIANVVSFFLDPSNIMMIINAAVQMFMGLVQAVPRILGALIGAFGNLFGALWSNLQGMFANFAANFGNAIGGIFRNAINGVIGFIENFINLPIGAINGFIDVVNGVLEAVGASIGHIPTVSLPRLASGGIVPATAGGRIIMAGEAGEDEWVVPESKMASMIEQLESRRMGAGGGITINISGVFATSPSEQRKVAEQIYQRLQELDRARFGGASI